MYGPEDQRGDRYECCQPGECEHEWAGLVEGGGEPAVEQYPVGAVAGQGEGPAWWCGAEHRTLGDADVQERQQERDEDPLTRPKIGPRQTPISAYVAARSRFPAAEMGHCLAPNTIAVTARDAAVTSSTATPITASRAPSGAPGAEPGQPEPAIRGPGDEDASVLGIPTGSMSARSIDCGGQSGGDEQAVVAEFPGVVDGDLLRHRVDLGRCRVHEFEAVRFQGRRRDLVLWSTGRGARVRRIEWPDLGARCH
ncbi:hypothetical protein OG558_23090 [Kribbella sp. NBC_01510]|uniref:hypothetical protein n=1 Tax=Kribbella sp. NBC_01510 TaxID=2903581 RepID=UPI00386D321F